MPERSRPMPPSGQRSQTRDSWSVAVNAAPASASVAGNVVGTPGPGLASKTPRRSDRSTMAWPAIVSTTAAATTRTVSIRPGPRRGEPWSPASRSTRTRPWRRLAARTSTSGRGSAARSGCCRCRGRGRRKPRRRAAARRAEPGLRGEAAGAAESAIACAAAAAELSASAGRAAARAGRCWRAGWPRAARCPAGHLAVGCASCRGTARSGRRCASRCSTAIGSSRAR